MVGGGVVGLHNLEGFLRSDLHRCNTCAYVNSAIRKGLF